jgi:hypothetical protein
LEVAVLQLARNHLGTELLSRYKRRYIPSLVEALSDQQSFHHHGACDIFHNALACRLRRSEDLLQPHHPDLHFIAARAIQYVTSDFAHRTHKAMHLDT